MDAMAGTTTADTLLDGRLHLRQPADGYRVAVDPVLLAAAIPATSGDAVLDVGTGVGAAALCLAQRVPGCRIVGIEIQPSLAALAQANAAANACAESVQVVEGDIAQGDVTKPLAALEMAGLATAGFDHVMTNPPYLRAGDSRVPASPSK